MALSAPAITLVAQQPSPTAAPGPRAVVKPVAEGVYIFEYAGYQSMFVVDPGGVLVTDPISPQAAAAYLEELRRITSAPIRYVVYSHHHYDHIAGGKQFKDAGARIIAHKRAKERLEALKGLDIALPDEAVDNKRTLKLGGTTLELHYTGRNHSDSSLVMFLPKEKIIFAVDFNSLGAMPSRLAVNDSYPGEWEASLKKTLALKWEKMIPGHPGPGGRLGTKQDAQDQLTFLQDASAAVRAEARQGRCWEPVESQLKLPKYSSWAGYEANLPFVLRRYCGLWGRGF